MLKRRVKVEEVAGMGEGGGGGGGGVRRDGDAARGGDGARGVSPRSNWKKEIGKVSAVSHRLRRQ